MLIPYPGEKSSIANFISPRIPTDIESYIEPFAGMFGVYFSLRFSKMNAKYNIYSDPDAANARLFRKMRYSEDFIKDVKKIRLDRERHSAAMERIAEDRESIEIDHLIRLCCGEEWNGSLEFDVFKMKFAAYKYHIDRISAIECQDWEECVERHDSNKSFFYINPPADQGIECHSAMAAAIGRIKGRAIISTEPFKGISRIYSGLKIERIWTISGEECLICN